MDYSKIAIQVSSLSKVYPLYKSHRDRLKEALHPMRKKYHTDFYALKNVSFEIKRGETVGIIGQNGSGKSTLLKILSNVLTPTTGTCEVNGKVSSLLELGTGFNPELTGIENVYFNGTLLGFTRAEMNEKMDSILSFADIGEFVSQPVKTYSSGMYVRLAFSIATQVDPEILIVDEALSVGDMFFQAKCISRMKTMIENEGTTLLMVSHAMDTVKALCTRGILLNRGELLMNGSASEVAQRYFELRVISRQKILETADNQADNLQPKAKGENAFHAFLTPSESFIRNCHFQRIRNGKAEFLNIALFDENENETVQVKYGQKVTLRMAIRAADDIPSLGYAYHIRDKNGVDVIYGSSGIINKRLYDLHEGDVYLVDWTFTLQILHGSYTIACVLSIPMDTGTGQVDFCDFIPIACQFEMEQRYPIPLYGLVFIDNEVIIRKVGD